MIDEQFGTAHVYYLDNPERQQQVYIAEMEEH
ncbi:small, acid-soluble spore protein, H family [Sediminibacillus albus]